MTRGGPLPGGGGDGPATRAPRQRDPALGRGRPGADDRPPAPWPPAPTSTGCTSCQHPRAGIPRLHRRAHGQVRRRRADAHALGRDLEVIERRAAALGDCRLIVFDPVSAYLGGRERRRAAGLAPLKDMAERLGAAVVLITHHSKQGASGTNGKYRVLGSIAYVGVCRANFLFLEDPDDPTGRRGLMLDNGGNLAAGSRLWPTSSTTRASAPVCDWLPETIDLDADARAGPCRQGRQDRHIRQGLARRHECEQWLRGYLADGPRPAKECEQAAHGGGIQPAPSSSGLARPWQSAAFGSGFGKGACYHLSLAEADSEPPGPSGTALTSMLPRFLTHHLVRSMAEHGRHERPRGHAPPFPDTSSRAEHGGAWRSMSGPTGRSWAIGGRPSRLAWRRVRDNAHEGNESTVERAHPRAFHAQSVGD